MSQLVNNQNSKPQSYQPRRAYYPENPAGSASTTTQLKRSGEKNTNKLELDSDGGKQEQQKEEQTRTAVENTRRRQDDTEYKELLITEKHRHLGKDNEDQVRGEAKKKNTHRGGRKHPDPRKQVNK